MLRDQNIDYPSHLFVSLQVHPDTGISGKAMSIMNSFVNDVFERIASEASRLAHYSKRSTMSSREIQVGNQKFDNSMPIKMIEGFFLFLMPCFADGRPPHSARRAVETRRVRGNQGHHQVHGQQDAQVAVLASAAAGSNPSSSIHPNGPR